ncbi:MAG: HlyD family efflux transporter periplasmic adaptor subunit [Bacteroidota bacterium]
MGKKYFSVLAGILIVALGLLVFTLMNAQKKSKGIDANEVPKTLMVRVKPVALKDIPYRIEATGILRAKERIDIYSEVQGTLLRTTSPFKIGNRFKKGETLIAMDSEEHAAQIKSNRSDLINQIAAMLPDMEIDYPNLYKKWEVYLNDLKVDESTPELPKFTSNGEKLFISGKNIYRTYFNVKNLEERLGKYTLRAPFGGIVTESNVNVGTLVRSGQKIGEFIDNSIYELQLSIPASASKFLATGKKVDLQHLDGLKGTTGIITRINAKVDQDTQTVAVIVEVSGESLKDGQYLRAQLLGGNLKNVFAMDNALIQENSNVYILKDSVLHLKPVQVLNYQDDLAVVTGLDNGTLVVDQQVANAYPGMPIKISN